MIPELGKKIKYYKVELVQERDFGEKKNRFCLTSDNIGKLHF